jgi:HK97 family phage prohead protease
MNRAYSMLEIRAVSEDDRTISGIASTPSPDRMSDVVEPMGAKFAIPMPLLWQHDAGQPIGQVEFAKPTKNGIPFKARLLDPALVESETLKDRLQLAWDSIKNKLVRAVSIGFRPLEYSVMDDGGYRFLSWEWVELSAVTIPANADCTITSIKSIDAGTLALQGKGQPEEIDLTGAKLVPAVPPAKVVHVAKLSAPARDRADPFVIRKIKHTA